MNEFNLLYLYICRHLPGQLIKCILGNLSHNSADTMNTLADLIVSVCITLHCIVFINFYSASHSKSLSEALLTIAIDTVSEFTRQSAPDNCK